MKKFLGHIAILGLALAISIGFVFSKADGYSDAFYLKFTSSKQSNLILGNSKAAQGLQPNILKQNFQKKEFYNYAFAMYSSPYGKAYYESIQKKLNTDNTDQTFILTIDPWSLCSTTKDPNDSLNFRDNNSYLAAISNPNQKINYQYLFKYFDESYYKMLTKNPTAFLHDNGWLEVTLPIDQQSMERRTGFTLNSYKDKMENYNFSSLRYTYLLKTIEYLKKYGQVYLVRLPVHQELMEIENQLMPNFDQDIQLAIDLSGGYLDMSSNNGIYEYTDGVHLTKESGRLVSEKIGEWMLGVGK